MAESTVKIVFLGDASKLKGEIDGIDSKVDKSGSVFDGFGKKAALGLGAGGLAAGAAFVHFGQMGNALDAMGKKASTVFEGSKGEIDQWADANAKAFGLTDDQLTGLAANFGDLLKPMGFTADQAADMSKDVVGLSGALSAWSGGTVSASEASDILAKAMLGERDGLKGLGIAISEADVQARLAKNGTDKLTGAALEQAKAVATQELIFEKSTDAQKAWADGSMDAIKSQNSIKSSIGELQEQLATRLQPAFAAMSSWIMSTGIPALEQFAGWVQDNVVPAVQAMADGIGAAIGFLVEWWRENWAQIRDTATQVIENVRTVVEGVLGAIEAFWRTWGGTITSLVTGVFDGVRQVIEGALTVIQGIINVVMGLIRGDFSRVWEGIQAIFSGAWALINGIVDTAMAAVRALIETGMRLVAGVFDAAWEGIKTATSGAINAVLEFATALPGRIVAGLGDLTKTLVSKGLDIVNGLGTGMRNAWDALVMWVESIKNLITGAIGDAARWLWDIGRAIIQGLWDGMKDLWKDVTGWLGGLGGAIKNLKGPIGKDRVLLTNEGRAIITGLHDGMKSAWEPVPGWLEDLGDTMVGRASDMGDAMAWAVEDMGTSMVGSMTSSMDTMVDVVTSGADRAVKAWELAVIAIDEINRSIDAADYNPDGLSPDDVLERANEERRKALGGASVVNNTTVNVSGVSDPVRAASLANDYVARTLASNQMRVALAGA